MNFISDQLFDKLALRITTWRAANSHLTDEEAIEKLGKLFENSDLILKYMGATK